MTTQIRAAKGGQVGDNGSFYKGGEFLPVSTTEKGSKRYVAPMQPPVSTEVKRMPTITADEAADLIAQVTPMLEGLTIPSQRRPGGEFFGPSYILRNVSGVSREAATILVKLSRIYG